MQITEAGKRFVASREFALELRSFLAEVHRDHPSEEHGRAVAISVIAWVLAGRDWNTSPQSAEEALELATFVNENAPEINAIAGKCLENLVDHDCGDTVQ
jgi:hypothetical protein